MKKFLYTDLRQLLRSYICAISLCFTRYRRAGRPGNAAVLSPEYWKAQAVQDFSPFLGKNN